MPQRTELGQSRRCGQAVLPQMHDGGEVAIYGNRSRRSLIATAHPRIGAIAAFEQWKPLRGGSATA